MSKLFNSTAGACPWPGEAPHPHLPRGHLHQQHQHHAVQEGVLRGRRSNLSRGHQVRSQVRGSLLEQLQVQHVDLHLHDDDFLGDSLWCLVSTSNVQEGGKGNLNAIWYTYKQYDALNIIFREKMPSSLLTEWKGKLLWKVVWWIWYGMETWKEEEWRRNGRKLNRKTFPEESKWIEKLP